MTMRLYEFYKRVDELRESGGQRLGQAGFNALVEIHPKLAERIRGTDKDPFHDDGKWDTFVEYIEWAWYITSD